MRLLPRTMFGQVALALFASLLVVQMVGLWLLLDDRGRLNYKLLAEYSAQRMAGIATVLDMAEPAERTALAHALSVQPTTLSLSQPWALDKTDASEDARNFAAEASRQLESPLDIQVLNLERIDPFLAEVHPPPLSHRDKDGLDGHRKSKLMARTYVAQIRLHDGTVVTFHHLLPVPATDLPFRLIAMLALLAISTIALSVWMVRRLTRPLVNFARGATGFAKNLNHPPIPESGPQEVREAATAFNAMQRDIRRLVETRAQALSAVSHDLRLPITRIRLRMECEVPEPTREKIERDLAEMDAMISHTLEFLRGSNGEQVAAVNLNSMLDSLIEDMEEMGVNIQRIGQCAAPIKARPHALRRCIANLLDNARFYGKGEIRVDVTDQSDTVRIAITDNGPGIPPDQLEKVFEPYIRLETSRAKHTGGTGLGLTIAKAIAEGHGGTLTLESAQGLGATAILTLPNPRD